MRAGLRYMRHAGPLRAILVRTGLFMLADCAFWTLLPMAAHGELGLDAFGYGTLLGCVGRRAAAEATRPRGRQRRVGGVGRSMLPARLTSHRRCTGQSRTSTSSPGPMKVLCSSSSSTASIRPRPMRSSRHSRARRGAASRRRDRVGCLRRSWPTGTVRRDFPGRVVGRAPAPARARNDGGSSDSRPRPAVPHTVGSSSSFTSHCPLC
jgi:Transmembrane secretion effector